MNLLIGSGMSQHPDYTTALSIAFAQATQSLDNKLPSLIILHLSPQYPIPKVLQELKKLAPQALIVGSCTDLQINSLDIATGLMLTTISSEEAYALTCSIENLSLTDPSTQINQVITQLALPNQPFPSHALIYMNTQTNWEILQQTLKTALPNTTFIGSLNLENKYPIFLNETNISSGLICVTIPKSIKISQYMYHTASQLAPVSKTLHNLPQATLNNKHLQFHLPTTPPIKQGTHWCADKLSLIPDTINNLFVSHQTQYQGLYVHNSQSRYDLLLNYAQQELNLLKQNNKKSAIFGAISTCPMYIDPEQKDTPCIYPHHQLIIGLSKNT